MGSDRHNAESSCTSATGVRMNNLETIIKVKAILIQTICYNNSEGEVKLDAGTLITVDPERHIGLCGSEYFDLDRSEYRVMYLN